MTLSTLIPLASLVCYSILLWINLRQDLRFQVNSLFSFYLFSMIVWSFGSLMIHVGYQGPGPLFWNRFMILGSTAMPITFFAFVQVFLGKERKPWVILGICAYLAIQAVNLSGNLVLAAWVTDGRLYNQYGPGLILPSVCWVFFIGFSALDLYQEYRKTRDIIYRNRIKYLWIVIFVIFVGSLTNSTPLQIFPIDIAFNIVSALLIAYAILRYQLLDISVVIRKGLLYFVPAILIGAIYFLIFSLTLVLHKALTRPYLLLVSLLVAALTAAIAPVLHGRGRDWADRLLFRAKYDLGLMLQRLSLTAASVLDLDSLIGMLLTEITTTLHISKAAVFLKGEECGRYNLVGQEGTDQRLDLNLNPDHPIVNWLIQHDEVLTRENVEVFPQFRSLWEQELQDLHTLDAELFIPLKTRGSLVGILVIGQKLSRDSYSADDQLTLTALANQTAVALENARLYKAERQQRDQAEAQAEELRRREGTLTLLNEIARSAMETHESAVMLDQLTARLKEIFKADECCLTLWDEESETASLAAFNGPEGENLPQSRLGKSYSSFSAAVIEAGRVIMVPDVLNSPYLPDHKAVQLPFRSALGLPLLSNQGRLGAALLGFIQPHHFSENEAELSEQAATHIALAIANLKLRETLRHQAIRDPLTNLFNRRYMEETLERELSRAERKSAPLGIILLDIDNFKRFNDTFGHKAGDEILRKLGDYLEDHIRKEDVACRFGGEEFILILPDTPLEIALRRAEELRIGVKGLQTNFSGQILEPISLSLGVSVFPDHSLTREGLFLTADKALYSAKKQGRDQTAIATHEGDG